MIVNETLGAHGFLETESSAKLLRAFVFRYSASTPKVEATPPGARHGIGKGCGQMLKFKDRGLVETLAELSHEYRHYQQEHGREKVHGATRHRIASEMQRARERFQRLLSQWVQDESLRSAWNSHFYDGGPLPDAPRLATPPAFKGLTESGATIEVRPSEDGGYDIVVDGSVERHEAVPWHLDPDMIEPIQIGEHTCREAHGLPPQAIGALADFLGAPGSEPPWRWLPALFEEGLVDETFGLTPRGFRVLGKAAARAVGEPTPITFGILAADGARARLFVLNAVDGEYAPTIAPLVEVLETTNPQQRTGDRDLFSDTRPGLRREGPQGPRHGVNDRREGHRRDVDRRFAFLIAKQAGDVWRKHGVSRALLVASPGMLGLVRRAMARANPGQPPWSVRELPRNLTRLAPPALHDVLATDGLLPSRGRLPPLQPSPGAPT
jgi:hypothetical protein